MIKTIRIFVNGTAHNVEKDELTYREIVELAFGDAPINPTVQYSRGLSPKTTGTVVQGASVIIQDGTEFDVVVTTHT